jgi:hypothetical protein
VYSPATKLDIVPVDIPLPEQVQGTLEKNSLFLSDTLLLLTGRWIFYVLDVNISNKSGTTVTVRLLLMVVAKLVLQGSTADKYESFLGVDASTTFVIGRTISKCKIWSIEGKLPGVALFID